MLTAALRLLPWKPPNFGAVGALSVYAGARLPWYVGLALPLAVMYVTDLILWGAFDWRPFSVVVYAAYLFAVGLGWLVRRTNSPWKIGAAALAGDAVFFLATNAGAWLSMERDYPRDVTGLFAAYTAGLPFLKYTLLSTVVFVPLFFGAHAWLTRPVAQIQTEPEV